MNVFILGLGNVGKALADTLRAQGHHVEGSTTTPAKVESLAQHVDKVHVLRGDESEKLAEASQSADVLVVCVAPDVKKTRTKEEREQHYQQVLEESCKSAANACQRVIFLSSFSVYGDGGEGQEPISESTPTANHDEPSSKYYQRAENHVLASSHGCVLRFPDMYGAPGDLSFSERVKMAIDYFGGNAIFGADAPLYAIHFEDVVASVVHAINEELSGIFNVCDDDNLPASNQQVFDAICAEHGWPALTFLNQIKAPNRKISAAKIYQSGYRVKHPDPNLQYLS
ncbi:NAD-dependent epimerase/dehydratase family protein [Thalassotalea mangrovi]|uniref:NAD-dependent epimerase/dehydratase family protein n=1 Tax=Thalassotalea mangrovi TaxID=2572245 RepID=A0A4U1B6C7_9GAMM|nr:NAD-dependent epimerase/dehydratase family protein [Thalassotalea mangrovi]TKB46055.1 NAD-dependent epimerase/dehydratase family protein [Thalassotalea mangrovi]